MFSPTVAKIRPKGNDVPEPSTVIGIVNVAVAIKADKASKAASTEENPHGS
jgi:hypothetical protein